MEFRPQKRWNTKKRGFGGLRYASGGWNKKIYIYEGCSKFLHAEKDIFAEKKIYFRQTLANLMFIFRGTSGEYRTGPRTNEPP